MKYVALGLLAILVSVHIGCEIATAVYKNRKTKKLLNIMEEGRIQKEIEERVERRITEIRLEEMMKK